MKSILLALLFSLQYCIAQDADLDPVSWTFHAEKNEDGKTILSFDAKIDDKWGVYSQYLAEGGPIPTSIVFEEVKGCTLSPKNTEDGEKHEGYDEMFAMDVVKYKHWMKLTTTVEPDKKCGKVKGYLEFMCCDDTRCLAPKQVPFEFEIKK